MALEVELKLTLSPHHVESLKLQPLLQSDKVTALGSQTLKNTYYDTPEHLLSQHKVALRIRQKGEQFIQTLKTLGTSEAGLHSRKEWEWVLPSADLDHDLLQSAEWPAVLASGDIQSAIDIAFHTDFTRTLWLLDTLDSQGNPLKAEIALDQGHVSYHGRTDPLCELELELLEGDAHELVNIALELARAVPLLISDISKAERGYRLHQASATPITRSDNDFSEDTTPDAVFGQLLAQELGLWTRCFETWKFAREHHYVLFALEALRNIGALYESFSDIAAIDLDGEINQRLLKLTRQLRDIDAWRRTAQLAGLSDHPRYQEQAQRAIARMEVLLQTTDPGILALLMANQLIQHNGK